MNIVHSVDQRRKGKVLRGGDEAVGLVGGNDMAASVAGRTH